MPLYYFFTTIDFSPKRVGLCTIYPCFFLPLPILHLQPFGTCPCWQTSIRRISICRNIVRFT